MNSKIFLLLFSIIILSCSSGNIRHCKSILKNNVGSRYSLETKCDYETKIVEMLDSGNQLLVITYKDNSKIFISSEIEYCPPFSLLFLSEKQTGMFTFHDLLVLNGRSENLTSWRIEKRSGFILGYYDVPNEVEGQYRNIILSLKRN